MLDSGMAWSEVAQVGNSMRSTAVNCIVRGIKNIEMAQRGKPSQARQPFLPAKFEPIMETLCINTELEVGMWLSAYLSFMYNMTA